MRYKIVDESQSVHCCFTKTVVDTTRPVMIHGEHHDDKYEAMCECIDEDAAPVICDALNAADRFRWIPATERLPDEEQRVLVWSQSNGLHIAYLDLWRQWRDTEDNCGKKITHWMPLPEPPRCEGC